MSWQPIETARKDGTWIKLLIPYNPEKYSEADCTDEGCWDKQDICFRFVGDDGPDDIQPTHWMPLPAPPSPTPTEDAGE
jgi:hypothetical protein